MSLINNLKEIRKLDLGEQKFVGEIVDNQDPLKLGRVRVRVLELFDSKERIPDSSIPWAIKEDTQFLGTGSKQFCIPKVGTFVTVYFSKGDIYSPVYCGEVQSKQNYDSEQEEDYGDVVLKKDRGGNKFKNNLAKQELDLVYNGKVILNISKLIQLIGQDDLELTISKKLKETVGGDKEETVSGKSTETVSGNKEITATKIIFTSANAEFSGNVKILGNLEVTGNTTLNGTTTTNGLTTIQGKQFLLHTHTSSLPGVPTGPVN